MARLRDRRVGPPEGLHPHLAELRAVRGATGSRGRALRLAEGRTSCAARAEGPLPARQPACLQPEVLPELGAALRRLRAPAGSAAGRDSSTGRRGLPTLQ